jgi:ankyrin repeat protein
LIIAAKNGNAEIVKLLVEHSPTGNVKSYFIDHLDDQDFSALHHAAAGGFLEIVKILIEQGNAKINTLAPYIFGHFSEEKAAGWDEFTSQSALKIAEKHNKDEIVSYLKGVTSTKETASSN